MKVSLNWLKAYINLDYSPEEIGEMLTDIGLEVEGMEKVDLIKGKFIEGGLQGVVVGFVEECMKHPNSDKLSLTKVNIGAETPLQIVCGAPNVAQGQKVLVATIGTTLHFQDGTELKMKKTKIRGEASEGMICAEDELGIGDDHDGILVMDPALEVGTSAAKALGITSDYVYEIGLTPNRSDATNHLGVARDLAAYLKINKGADGSIKLPDVSAFTIDNESLPIDIEVADPALCPRYAGLTISNLKIGESPEWIKNYLNAIGVRSISNVVDITNYVLHEYGQPLHAFDYEQITDKKIIVTTLEEGTTFASLDEIDRKLSAEDLMICDGQRNGMCIGGVFGGIKSGVKDQTTTIFLESAHFNPKSIRRTSMRHNLRTDAAKVFEKGSDPNVVVEALKRAALLMQEYAGGEISSPIYDLYPAPIERKQVKIRYQKINDIIGEVLTEETIKSILEALDMNILEEQEDALLIDIPTDKSDVLREIDVIEEILRIYGFNKVPIPNYIKTAITVGSYPDVNQVRNRVGDHLAANGFYEMMAVSLSESKYYLDVLSDLIKPEQLVYINNTSNVHLDIMRPDMLFSGLEAILRNQNRQQNRIRLFELGRTYMHDIENEGAIKEDSHLSLFIGGEKKAESWLHNGKGDTDFYYLKGVVHQLLSMIGIEGYQKESIKTPIFSYGLSYFRGPQPIVRFGRVNGALLKKMGIRGEIFYADFSWKTLMRVSKKYRLSVEELNKYPTTRRDLALVIDNSVKFDDIASIANKVGKKLIKEVNLFDVYENAEQLGEGKKSYAVSFVFENPTKTLVDKEVDKVISKLIKEYENKLGASLRK